MNLFSNPSRDEWTKICERPQLELGFLESSVRNIMNRVKNSGDKALREITLQFDKVELGDIQATEAEIAAAAEMLTSDLKNAINKAAENIRTFHAAQRRDVLKVDTMPGVSCWRKGVAIDKVGIYIPGGTAPLFSTVLMLGVPASLAASAGMHLSADYRFDQVRPGISLYGGGPLEVPDARLRTKCS